MSHDVEFVVPVYRDAPFLDQTIASLHRQRSTPQVTVRVVAPRDPAFAGDLAHRWPEVRVLVSETSGGIGPDWEAAMAAAKGPWVTIAHSDDVYAADYSARIAEAFAAHPQAVCAFTFSRIEGIATPGLGVLRGIKRALTPARFASGPTLLPAARMRRALRWGNFVPCSSVSYNLPRVRQLLGARDLFSPSLRFVVDWDAWARLSAAGGAFVCVPEPLVAVRVHPGQASQRLGQDGTRWAEERTLLDELWGDWRGRALHSVVRFGQGLARPGE